jgi:hypothetical protein
MAPFDTLEEMVMRLMSQVYGLAKHSINWLILKVLFSIPVLLLLSLSMANSFSSFVNLLFIGLSGRNKTTQMPTAMVTIPHTRNIICHDLKVVPV